MANRRWGNSPLGGDDSVLQTAAPSISPAGGTYATGQTVAITPNQYAAVIYCTSDGSTPTYPATGTTQLYSGSFGVTQNTTVKAIEIAASYQPSTVSSAAYQIQAAAPTFSPPGGTYGSTQSVSISSTTPSPAIYYTTDGSTPTYPITGTTQLYTGAITVSSTETIQALAQATNYANSSVSSAAYTINSGGMGFDYYVSPTGSDANNGSLATPWAITSVMMASHNAFNVANFALTRGKRIGFLPGTYNISTYMDPTSGGYNGAIQIDSGTSAASTYYGSSDSSGNYAQGTATLTALTSGGIAGGGLSYPANGPIIQGGLTTPHTGGYFIIDGLRLVSYTFKAIRVGGLSAGYPPLTGPTAVQNCEFTGQNFTGISGNDNESSVWVDGVQTSTSSLVNNNWFHDNQGSAGAGGDLHLASIFTFNSANVTITNNTGYNSGGLAWGKDQANQGATVAYNYCDMSMMTTGGASGMAALMDFTGAYGGTTGLTLTSNFHHNILVTDAAFNAILAGAAIKETWQTPVNFYNNTIVAQSSSNAGIWLVSRNANQVSVYNNIIAGTAGASEYGTFCMGTTSVAILDYNGYITAANYGIGASQGASGGYPSSTGTLATYQAAVTAAGGPSGLQAHSVANNSPLFVGSGTLAPFYQLQSGSPFKNKGSSNGTTGGSTCDMGAWGGATPPASIGCSFATAS